MKKPLKKRSTNKEETVFFPLETPEEKFGLKKKEGKKPKLVKLNHRHKWEEDEGCMNCGCYVRYCTKDDCHEMQLMEPNGKVAQGFF